MIDRIIVGGYDEEGNKNPQLVTYVFELDKSDVELKNSEKYVVIASLDCEYEFWGYDLNELRYRTRVHYTSFPIRIAIKTK